MKSPRSSPPSLNRRILFPSLLCLALVSIYLPVSRLAVHSVAAVADCMSTSSSEIPMHLSRNEFQFKVIPLCASLDHGARPGVFTVASGARHALPAGSILQVASQTATPPSPIGLATEVLAFSTATATPRAVVHPVTAGCAAGSTQQVARSAEPAVLRITVAGKTGEVTGTGFVINEGDSGTYVLTSLHLVQGAAPAQISVTSPVDGKTFKVQVLLDQTAKSLTGAELALLRLQPTLLPVLSWGDSQTLEPGQSVVSIGYATGEGGPPSIMQGMVSAVHRDLRDAAGPIWIQHQTSLDPASAGGPLLDLSGAVVGVNLKEKLQTIGKNQSLQVQGIFFALPAQGAAKEAGVLLTALRAKHIPQSIAAPAATATTATVSPTETAALPASQATASTTPTPTPAALGGSTYTGVGYTLTEPAGWIVKSLKDGTPVLLSADQYAAVIVQENLVSQAPTSDQVKGALGQIAQSVAKQLGVQVTTTYNPITIGAMSGLTAVITASDGSVSVLASLVSDGQHLVFVQESLERGATPQDGTEATALTQSITPTN